MCGPGMLTLGQQSMTERSRAYMHAALVVEVCTETSDSVQARHRILQPRAAAKGQASRQGSSQIVDFGTPMPLRSTLRSTNRSTIRMVQDLRSIGHSACLSAHPTTGTSLRDSRPVRGDESHRRSTQNIAPARAPEDYVQIGVESEGVDPRDARGVTATLAHVGQPL